MNKVFLASIVLILFAGVAATSVPAEIRSGSFVSDQGGVPHEDPLINIRSNILQNPGFETGDIAPWTSNGWVATNADANSGIYSALGITNIYIRQDFTPIDVTTINSITNYEKQPSGVAFAAVDFIYSSEVDSDEFLVSPGVDWTFQDMTAHLRPSGNLSAIRFWSYSGAGDQATWIDDVSIDAQGATPARSTTWGAVKALYH
jgi:hypothetical protein